MLSVDEILKGWYGGKDSYWDEHPAEKPAKTKAKEEGTCPKCQHAGTWVRMALVCPTHGMFAGC